MGRQAVEEKEMHHLLPLRWSGAPWPPPEPSAASRQPSRPRPCYHRCHQLSRRQRGPRQTEAPRPMMLNPWSPAAPCFARLPYGRATGHRSRGRGFSGEVGVLARPEDNMPHNMQRGQRTNGTERSWRDMWERFTRGRSIVCYLGTSGAFWDAAKG